jgi:hypothetical protein
VADLLARVHQDQSNGILEDRRHVAFYSRRRPRPIDPAGVPVVRSCFHHSMAKEFAEEIVQQFAPDDAAD